MPPLNFHTPSKDSLVNRFGTMTFRTPSQRRAHSPDASQDERGAHRKFGLTPVMEELSGLRLTSTVKKTRDDFQLSPPRASILEMEIPQWSLEESSRPLANLQEHTPRVPPLPS